MLPESDRIYKPTLEIRSYNSKGKSALSTQLGACSGGGASRGERTDDRFLEMLGRTSCTKELLYCVGG